MNEVEWAIAYIAPLADNADHEEEGQALYTALAALRAQQEREQQPEIVCLCGSTRFKDAFIQAQEQLTLDGCIVLSVGMFGHADNKYGSVINADAKERLDELHKRKIDLCDSVLVLNVGGYIGDSTRSEIKYANKLGRPVRYLQPL